jgi:hypothetical protein
LEDLHRQARRYTQKAQPAALVIFVRSYMWSMTALPTDRAILKSQETATSQLRTVSFFLAW